MTKFNDFLSEQMKDSEVKAEYEALAPEFSIIQAMIDAGKASAPCRRHGHDPENRISAE